MKYGRLIGLMAGFFPLTPAVAQSPEWLPFAAGERLTFTVRASKFGTVGRAEMSVTGPVEVRGVNALLLSFETHVGVLFMKSNDTNRSWIDAQHMTSLRFAYRQRRTFSSARDSVEIFPDAHRWTGMRGDSGTIAGDAPLDDLSFLYFLRTIEIAPDSVYRFERSFDKRRIPTIVRYVRRDTLHTPAGDFSTVELEMRMKDSPDFKRDWLVRIWISDDPCRIPVRMETAVPVLGTGIMTLDSAVTPACLGADANRFRREVR